MRKLSPKSLQYMDGEFVLVHDCAYDAYDQICKVHVNFGFVSRKNSNTKKVKVIKYIKELFLENDEFIFEYNNFKCKNGEFEVFALNKKEKEAYHDLFR